MAECISGAAFHNALRCLKPRRQPIWPGFFPAWRYRRESSLLPVGLEAQPAFAEFARDRRRAPECCPPTLRGSAPVQIALELGVFAFGSPSVNLPPLGRGGRNQPHLPPLAARIEERPVTQRQVLRRRLCAKVSAHNLCFAGAVPEMPLFRPRFPSVFFGKRTSQRVSSFLPASR